MGSARVTYDVDLCYRRTSDNLERLAAALRTLSLALRGAPLDLKFMSMSSPGSSAAVNRLLWRQPKAPTRSTARRGSGPDPRARAPGTAIDLPHRPAVCSTRGRQPLFATRTLTREVRMARRLIQSSVIYRDLTRAYPVIVRGEGVYLWDADGKRYLDGSGGASAVTSIGHGVSEIVEAMASQARRVAFVPMHMFTSEPLPALAEAVAKFAPGDLNKVWFVSGGSEATENAAKLARQYWLECGKPSKSIVIGRWQSFHGNTFGSLGFGGHTYRRRKYVPMFQEASHLPPMYCYRCHFNLTYPGCEAYCASYLERLIRMQGPENIAAFIAEPVVGATLGAVPPVPEYFPKIREICERNEVLFIADEVMTGFGRTGANFAVDHWGVVPDLIATAKGISGGYMPLGAVIVRDEIFAVFERNQSNFVGGHTYTGHPVAAAVGLAVLRYIQERDLVRNAREVGAHLLEKLRGLMRRHPIVGDVRGLGLMVGLEFVADRTTRAPFPPEREVARAIALEALDRGLVTYPGTGSVDGVMGDHMKFTPSLVLTREQADELTDMLEGAIGAVEARL